MHGCMVGRSNSNPDLAYNGMGILSNLLFRGLVFNGVVTARSLFRNNVFPALSQFRRCAYHWPRACGFVFLAGLPWSNWFRFSVDPYGFGRFSWSFEFL